jgi:uncharacterized protein YgiM (DUF1202 family)
MKKVFFISIPSIIVVLIVYFLYQYISGQQVNKGALQVTASPKSKVYVDNKLLGTTPLCLCDEATMIKTGEYMIRVVPEDTSFAEFQERISIEKAVLTVVDRKFGKGATSEGSIISLEKLSDDKTSQLLILSSPIGAEVFLDNTGMGVTPKSIENVSVSDHTIKVRKDGYTEKTVRIRTQKGYKLLATIHMGLKESLTRPTPTPFASPSASLSVTPTVTPKFTPTPTRGKTAKMKIIILETPNGFLRVRQEASTASPEIARVNTGDEFDVIEESANGWIKITTVEGETGWVSGQFTEKK